MATQKPHLEFFPVDMENGWQTPPGYKEGFEQKVLASDLDEGNKRGSRSRPLRIRPAACCASARASIRKSRSCTTTGKRFSCSQATSSPATTPRAMEANSSSLQPTPS